MNSLPCVSTQCSELVTSPSLSRWSSERVTSSSRSPPSRSAALRAAIRSVAARRIVPVMPSPTIAGRSRTISPETPPADAFTSSSARTSWSGWLPWGPARRGPLMASNGDSDEPVRPLNAPNPPSLTENGIVISLARGGRGRGRPSASRCLRPRAESYRAREGDQRPPRMSPSIPMPAPACHARWRLADAVPDLARPGRRPRADAGALVRTGPVAEANAPRRHG